jgi:hypothetical protein
VLNETVAGGVTVNDTILHIAQEELPFGGVGPSGMGHYHGIEGFKTFQAEGGVLPVRAQRHVAVQSALWRAVRAPDEIPDSLRLLSGELLLYAMLSAWLVTQVGWTPVAAAGLALGSFLGLRLFITALTFILMLANADAVPGQFRIGPLRALRMALEEYAGLIVLFSVIQPFEAFWLGPDRLGKAAGRPPLLLIHGYQCNRGFWFWLRPRLEAAGWIVATHNLEPVWAGHR